MTNRSKNIWLRVIGMGLLVVILLPLICAKCYCQTIHREAEVFDASQGINNETCSEGGQNTANWSINDYADYKLNIPAGLYKIDFRVAGVLTGQNFQFKLGTSILTTVTVPNTGAYQKWTTVSANVTLAGANTYRILSQGIAWNMNWFDITPIALTPTTQPPGTGYTKSSTDSLVDAKISAYDKTLGDLLLRISGKDTVISIPFPGLKVKVQATKDNQ